MQLRSGEWVERGRRKYSTPLEEVFQNKVGGDSGFDEVAGKMRMPKNIQSAELKRLHDNGLADRAARYCSISNQSQVIFLEVSAFY